MVPGLTEREFQALEAIRRDWLASEMTWSVPAPLVTPRSHSSLPRTIWTFLTRLAAGLFVLLRSNRRRPAIEAGGGELARPATGGRPVAGW
jgi:hypothetical protein